MELTQQKMVFFSPTQTTQKVLSAIAEGTGIGQTDQLNLTLPEIESAGTTEFNNELAIIGAPVYSGRVAMDAVKRLKKIKGNNTPAVITVVYGNREFDDALVELRDIAAAAGFVPVAAAAFIGEHSYSTDGKPVAHGRPDVTDLEAARNFGVAVADKLKGLQALDADATPEVPGNTPYKESNARGGIAPETDEGTCTTCGTCADVCPTNAISVADSVETDVKKCILCCACVKSCPSGARTLENEMMEKIRDWLHSNFNARKDPEVFI